jgi:phenylacetic acid degradation operon negative regulatory protein
MPEPEPDVLPVPDRRMQTSARTMLFSVLGEFVYREGRSPVWTSSLLYVLTGVGFSEEAARQSIARGAAAGWISGERMGRETRWSLTEATRRVFDAGSERVFAFSEPPAPWDGRWLVVSISVPHARRRVRKRLYSALSWAGLGNPAAGLWVTPHTERADEVRRVIVELGLEEYAVATVGEIGAIGLSAEDIVRRAWDLESVADSYSRLQKHFAAITPAPGDPMLFAVIELSDALRRFPFMDPQLPPELAPGWIGREAIVSLRALRDAWYEPAHRRWREIVADSEPRSPGSR